MLQCERRPEGGVRVSARRLARDRAWDARFARLSVPDARLAPRTRLARLGAAAVRATIADAHARGIDRAVPARIALDEDPFAGLQLLTAR